MVREGRPARRDEVTAAIDAGLPDLRRLVEAQGSEAVRAHARALALLPGAEAA